MGFCMEYRSPFLRSPFASLVFAFLLAIGSDAFAQSAGGSSGEGNNPDDPVRSATCHTPDSYDAQWVKEQLELVIETGKLQAGRQGCGKNDGERRVYTLSLSNPEFVGRYILMRVHGECQLSGTSVNWKKTPKKAGVAPNGDLACGCRVTEYAETTVAELSLVNNLVSSRSPRGVHAVVPETRTRAITIVPPRLYEGECGGSIYCKIQASEKIWVKESFSKLSLRITQEMIRLHSNGCVAPPAPVCSLRAKSSSPITEDICHADFGNSKSEPLHSQTYRYTTSVPERIAFFVDIPNPTHAAQVPVELCGDTDG